MSEQKTPAKLAHERHMECIHTQNRQGWLDNMAELHALT